MTNEQRITELSHALLTLAHWYEGDCGPIEPLDRVRAYLATFPEGQHLLQLDDEDALDPDLFPVNE